MVARRRNAGKLHSLVDVRPDWVTEQPWCREKGVGYTDTCVTNLDDETGVDGFRRDWAPSSKMKAPRVKRGAAGLSPELA